MQSILGRYHAQLRTELELYGATVEKFIGDAVMAVFGTPTAHEDDAERAVRAALGILAAIRDLNATPPGLDLEVRIGVATGEGLVRLGARPELGEGLVVGDVVNTAARLQTVAPPGGIVAGELTHRLTADDVDYRSLAPVTVKGKTEPLAIWQAIGTRPRITAEILSGPATPFVGRADELAALRSALGRTVREQAVHLVTITGEPGVGKSRLVRELSAFVKDVPELIRWRQGHCLPYGEGVAFWALGEIVKAEAGILESDDETVARAKLITAVSAVTTEDQACPPGTNVGTCTPASAATKAPITRPGRMPRHPGGRPPQTRPPNPVGRTGWECRGTPGQVPPTSPWARGGAAPRARARLRRVWC